MFHAASRVMRRRKLELAHTPKFAKQEAKMDSESAQQQQIKHVVARNLKERTASAKATREERLAWKHKNLHAKTSGCATLGAHLLLGCTLGQVLVIFVVHAVVVNVLFGALYFLMQDEDCCGNEDPGLWSQINFSFYVYTGFGFGSHMPSNGIVDSLIFVEALEVIIAHTLFAGVIFMKFVTPSVMLKWSDAAVIHNSHGVPTVSVRIGNEDGDHVHLGPTSAKMYVLIKHLDPYSAEWTRRALYVPLIASERYEFVDVWTIQHRIDSNSPLYGLTLQQLRERRVNIYVVVNTLLTSAQEQITSVGGYMLDDIEVGRRFDDQVGYTDGVVTFDYSKMSTTVPADVLWPAHDEELQAREAAGQKADLTASEAVGNCAEDTKKDASS